MIRIFSLKDWPGSYVIKDDKVYFYTRSIFHKGPFVVSTSSRHALDIDAHGRDRFDPTLNEITEEEFLKEIIKYGVMN